jgi:LPXTG-motif cell wall-anchored protein
VKKFLAPLMLSGLLVVVLAAPGGASAPSGSVIDGCAFTVTGDVSPGATVSISGTGFQEDAELPISVNNVVVGVTPPILNGGILPPTNVEIPGDATEPITIVIPCGAGPNSGVASQTFGAAALAFTGSDSTNTWIAVGLAAIVVGGVLVFGARRRSQLRSRQLHV